MLAIGLSVVVFTDRERQRVRLDVSGMILFTLAAGSITFAIIRAGEDGWTSRGPVIAFLAGALALAAFVVVQTRHENPLIDLALLRSPVFTGTTLAALLLTLSAFGSLALVSIWLQSVVGLDPLGAGLALLPLAGTAFLVAGALGGKMQEVGPARPIAGGMLLIGVGGLLLNLVQADSSWPALLPGLIVTGFGVGLSIPPLTSAALAAVPPERSGMASGVVNTARQLGLAFGVAVLGTVFTSRGTDLLRDNGVPQPEEMAQRVSGGQTAAVLAQTPAASREQLNDAIHQAFAAGLHGAFVLAGGLGVIGALLCYLLLRRAPTPTPWHPPTSAPQTAPEPSSQLR